MMNKNLIAFGAASLVIATTAFAQDEVSVTTTFSWENAYMFRGVQLAEDTFMPSIDIAYAGVYGGLWTAQPVGGESDEVDYYLGYGFDLADGISMDVGGTLYQYPDVDESTTSTTTRELYVGVAFDVLMSPSLYAYYDLDLRQYTFEASASYSFSLGEKLSLDASADLGYVIPDNTDEYVYGLLSLGLGYSINDSVSASIFGKYTVVDSSDIYSFDGDDQDSKLWYGLSVTAGF